MNVWILSVRELARLLRGRLTWLAAALTVLSPLAGLTVYRSASADTMQSLYVANPALAGGALCPAHPLRLRPYLPLPGGGALRRGGVPSDRCPGKADGPAGDGGADPGPHPSGLASLDGPYRGRRL